VAEFCHHFLWTLSVSVSQKTVSVDCTSHTGSIRVPCIAINYQLYVKTVTLFGITHFQISKIQCWPIMVILIIDFNRDLISDDFFSSKKSHDLNHNSLYSLDSPFHQNFFNKSMYCLKLFQYSFIHYLFIRQHLVLNIYNSKYYRSEACSL